MGSCRADVPPRQLRLELSGDWDSDSIELFQSNDRQGPVRGEERDRSYERSQINSLLQLPSLATTQTRELSHDDDFLLPARSENQRIQNNVKRNRLSGWRTGALISLAGALLVLVVNLAITIWVRADPRNEIRGAVGTLFRGDCAKTRSINIWIHLLVNSLSTLLLAASNYCMQVLVAPNRAEVNAAHARRRWLHIGVRNLRNLWYIRKDRVTIYVVLFMSSVPLHLFFNSVVFTRLQANEYSVVPTTESWMSGGKYDTTNFLNFNATGVERVASDFQHYRLDMNDQLISRNGTIVAKYKNVSTSQCFESYGDHYVSSVGNVYLIQAEATVWRNSSAWDLQRYTSGDFRWALHTKESEENDRINDTYTIQDANFSLPFLSNPEVYPSNGWRCPSHAVSACDTNNEYEIPRDTSKWMPYESTLKYCLIEQVNETCELQFSFAIAALVIIANAVKAICMALTLRMCGEHAAFVTIGDAVASFLDHPDPTTKGRCLQTRRHVEIWWDWNKWAAVTPGYQRDRRRCRPRRRRWAMAPSEKRWVATYWAYGFLIVASVPLIVRSLQGMPSDPKALWQTGFGAIRGNNLLSIRTSLLGGVLLANTPQALLSYMYLAFNALYTTMFVAAEWSSYGVSRKTLRVTAHAGQQRSTYWLGVPFRYAIPMTIVSGLFHWLASQSFFKVQIAITDMQTRDIVGEISTCGYSPVAIIFTAVVACAIALGGVVLSRLWYPAGIPLAGSNSAAISAACHAPPEDVDASLLPVQWGAVTHGRDDGTGNEKIGHCCFSSLPVEAPIAGRMYM